MSSRLLAAAFIAVALNVSLCQSARASLCFKGGTETQQAAIVRAYTALPECCQTSYSFHVQLLDGPEMNRYLEEAEGSQARYVRNDAIDGVYQNTVPTITLRVTSSESDVSATFTHEYGHFVWKRVLTPDQRSQYSQVYKTQRSAHCLVSTYAAVSTEEGFAEAFSFHTRQRDYLEKCDPKSCQCLDMWMFPSSPATIENNCP